MKYYLFSEKIGRKNAAHHVFLFKHFCLFRSVSYILWSFYSFVPKTKFTLSLSLAKECCHPSGISLKECFPYMHDKPFFPYIFLIVQNLPSFPRLNIFEEKVHMEIHLFNPLYTIDTFGSLFIKFGLWIKSSIISWGWTWREKRFLRL